MVFTLNHTFHQSHQIVILINMTNDDGPIKDNDFGVSVNMDGCVRCWFGFYTR